MKMIVISFLLVLLAVSCQKSEGLGGTGSITGTISKLFYNDDYSLLIHEKPAVDEEVYLTYNKHSFYDERIRTQSGGVFEFGGLIPGKYLVFLYSDDVTGESDKVSLEFEVTISDPEQGIDLGEITIEKL